jgi:catechol 2,3-dioxygenase-like lactoylglutathione lyase family enzyme
MKAKIVPASTCSPAAVLGLHHIKIIASDLSRSLAFYRDALGFELLYEAERSKLPVYDQLMGYENIHLKLAMMRKADQGPLLALMQFLNPPSESPHRELYQAGGVALALQVRDLETVIGNLLKRNVLILCHPQDIIRDEKRVASAAYIADPDGLRIELYEPFP